MNTSTEIKILTSVTTEEVLKGLEVDAKAYEGLYVDMENKPERKYVKDKAALISGMLKTLDRARIDESSCFTVAIMLLYFSFVASAGTKCISRRSDSSPLIGPTG